MTRRTVRIIWLIVAICCVPATLAVATITMMLGYAESESISTHHEVSAAFYVLATVAWTLPVLFLFALYRIFALRPPARTQRRHSVVR